jgi:hypothetical protein
MEIRHGMEKGSEKGGDTRNPKDAGDAFPELEAGKALARSFVTSVCNSICVQKINKSWKKQDRTDGMNTFLISSVRPSGFGHTMAESAHTFGRHVAPCLSPILTCCAIFAAIILDFELHEIIEEANTAGNSD